MLDGSRWRVVGSERFGGTQHVRLFSIPSCLSEAPVRVMGDAVMVNLLLPLTPIQKCSGAGRGFRRAKLAAGRLRVSVSVPLEMDSAEEHYVPDLTALDPYQMMVDPVVFL